MSSFDEDDADEALYSAGDRMLRETASSEDSLCGRCAHGTCYRRAAGLDVTVFCNYISRYVPSDILSCTTFRAKKGLSLSELREIAVLLDTRPETPQGGYR